MSHVKGLFNLQLLSVLLTAIQFSLLGRSFHNQSAIFFSRYPTVLASEISWSPHGNPGFTSTASHNGFSVPPRRNNAWTQLLPLATEGDFLNSFLVSLTLKPQPCGQSCQVLLFARAGRCPLLQLCLHQFSVF